jgi:uncharacterized NAD(P)/FAD-binding protein YdhS
LITRDKHVVIIGGGFSGALTAIHLARLGLPGQVSVTLVNPSPDIGRGLAYRYNDDNLLLNVPAGNMSAFDNEPGHFVDYCRSIDPSISHGSFVSRRIYGQYIQDLYSKTQEVQVGVIETLNDEVVTFSRDKGTSGWEIELLSGRHLSADQVVLAVGHQSPMFPIQLEANVRTKVIDAWDFETMHSLPRDQPVLIVGTGHSAVDALFCLSQSHPRRPIHLLSRHGLLPHQHLITHTAPKPQAFPVYLRSLPITIRAYTRALRQQLKAVAEQGGDWRDTLNELRPHSPQIWHSWPVAAQRQFLRHINAYWDIHRHRLAPMAFQRLDQLLADSSAHVIAGRIHSISLKNEGVLVEYRSRGSQTISCLLASAVVNCVGPSTDIQCNAKPLLVNLKKQGLIKPDAHGLGLIVTPSLQMLDKHEQPVSGLWYVGPHLKGVLWEATAVPELRVHAQHLAQTLITLK